MNFESRYGTTIINANVLLIKVLTLEIRLISLLLTLASSREPAEPNAGSMGVLPHPTVEMEERVSGQEFTNLVLARRKGGGGGV